MGKTLVLYVFHIFNERVEYFINHCIFYDENIDFVIISNDKNNEIKAPPFVKIIKRDNIGYDFGGWSDALLTDNLYQNYDTFLFVNSSVIGPFLPSNYQGNWINIYLNGLRDDIKLFGSTINTCYEPFTKSHVQSYIFATDKEALEYLIRCGIFSITEYETTFIGAIQNKEIAMSTKILQNGWNIGSLLPYYKGVDFRNPQNHNIQWQTDIMYPQYRNILWNEYELVFIKGNRIPLRPSI